jgi:N-acetylmuramoyl-L-alanine amidase
MRSKKYVWLFDPGHGGIVDGQYMTSGKRSPLWKDGTQYFEGVGNRQIVQKLIRKCDEHNIYNFDVVASEYDIALSERVKIANQYYKTLGNCIYVSIHSNGFSKESANGYSIYTSKGETKSDRIAEVFIDNMVKHFPMHKLRKDTRDGDKDKEAQFYVLRKTRCPAILIENFFMTNYKECKLLMNEEFQNRIVDCHFKSILQIEENGY